MATARFTIFTADPVGSKLLQVFQALLELTRHRAGCTACHLHHDTGQSGYVCFLTRWESEAKLLAFLRSQVMDRVLQLLELSMAPPEIVIGDASGARGLARLHQARERPGALERTLRSPGTTGSPGGTR